jgi:hypothetical protein
LAGQEEYDAALRDCAVVWLNLRDEQGTVHRALGPYKAACGRGLLEPRHTTLPITCTYRACRLP